MPKKAATRLWHRARDFDRQTRRKARHGGAVGHSALQVLHALIFDFLNFRSGRLDPSYAAIARKANVCERTVATAIQRLKGLGILNWVRRCAESWQGGRFVLEQETNAYAVLPASQWRGYREPQEAPPPAPGTWGDHPPLPSPTRSGNRGATVRRHHAEGDRGACLRSDRCARHGTGATWRSDTSPRLVSFTGLHVVQRNPLHP